MDRLLTSANRQELRRPPLAVALLQAYESTGIRLLLDYDGTLVPLAREPELATPDPELLEMLQRLTSANGIVLELVSGRPRAILDAWFGHLPIALWAEHGFWHRSPEGEWQATATVAHDWMARLLPILERFTVATPGSRLEVKSAAIAWHFRNVPRAFGLRQAQELRMLLGDALSNQPLEVLEGKKVIEVRWVGTTKAVVIDRPRPHLVDLTSVAFGDDRTDEDLLRALPDSSITVAVGQRLAGAKYVVDSHRDVRRLLRLLADRAVDRATRDRTANAIGVPLDALANQVITSR